MNSNPVPLRTLLRAFPGIPVKEAQELIAGGQVHSYPPNTVLCHEDAYETIFYILLDGRVKVTKTINAARKEVRLLKTLEMGDFFGEMALLQDAPRAASVTTLEQTNVLEIRKELFTELLRTSASLSRAMVQEVVRRLRQNDQMAIEDLRLKAGELANAYQQLAEQEYARREFLSTIAHELRTPLTAARGFLQMVETGLERGYNLDSDMQRSSIQTASRHIEQIITLVNDILFIQEMDLILPRFETVNLSEALRRVADASQPKLVQNRISLLMDLPGEAIFVAGDHKSLERALQAILDNAIKFSYVNGQVEVRLARSGERATIEVRDNGVGIPEDVLPRIFDRFFHTDQVDGRLFDGIGLGLSIARQVIEQHHGEIKVISKPKEGTAVRVTLNTATPAKSMV
ncbi:MAG: ATP-binding protein [Chloroflexota bacterium]